MELLYVLSEWLACQTQNLNNCSLKPLCSGMGEVVPARTSPTLLPPSPRTVLSLSCFKVSQCIKSACVGDEAADQYTQAMLLLIEA